MKEISEHRKFIVTALGSIEEGAHADVLLAQYPNASGRAAAQHILLGILRWRGSLDHLLTKLVRKKPKRIIRNILRIGVYELFFCHTPNHAVIDQAVELCKLVGKKHDKGFVNAVLRKASKMSINKNSSLNVPSWLLQRWEKAPEWLDQLQQPPAISLCWKDNEVAANSELNLLPAKIDAHLIEGVYYPQELSGSPVHWPGFDLGDWWVMNPAAAYAVDLAFKELGSPTEFTALDVCAAPGGKTFRLVSRGAQVVATDVSLSRLARLQENVARLQISIDIKQHNWLKPNPELGVFDIVFVDAPCSGTGVIRKHPEIKWKRTEQDVLALTILQRRILNNAAQNVKKGGLLVYSVCSVLHEEGLPIAESVSWPIVNQWSSFPPKGDEDGFQVYLLRQE